MRSIQWQKYYILKRDQDATTAPATQVAERIFKLSLIHALVIYQIPWIH